MKKLLIIALSISLVAFGSGMAFGWGIPIGKANIDISADNSDHSIAGDAGFWGLAGGGGAISGSVEGGAKGFIINGTVSANPIEPGTPDSFGGGNSQSNAISGPSIGTQTVNLAQAGAFLDLAASTPSFGFGGVAGGAYGQTDQFSLNTSGRVSPYPWSIDAATAGLATQESSGEFHGVAAVGVLGPYGGTAGFEATIIQQGGSMSQSYTMSGDGEGLGTQVGAYTNVATTGSSYNTGVGIACVDGNFAASGNVATLTSQNANGGNASAAANGSYSGAASLGKTYNGNANGYSQTFAGDNGVMYSGAGMSVTSTITHTPAP